MADECKKRGNDGGHKWRGGGYLPGLLLQCGNIQTCVDLFVVLHVLFELLEEHGKKLI